MDFGIAVATSTDSWKVVKRAEELGFSDAWFYDTQLLNPDVFIAMALAAVNTTTINLGTGVLIPTNRIAPVAANALASINKLAPGRTKFGVGTGFTGRRTMGQRAMKLKDMEKYINDVQGLLAGNTINWQSEGKSHPIQFLNPDMGLINIEDDIPLYVSAFGKKSRQLTADMKAGWLTFGGSTDDAINALGEMQNQWQAGNAGNELDSVLFTLGCVLKPGESPMSERSMAQAGPLVAVGYHSLVEGFAADMIDKMFPPERASQLAEYRKMYENYEPANARYLNLHRGHLMFNRPEELPFITDDLILGSTFTGTKEVLVEHLSRLKVAGFKQFTIQIVEGHEEAIEDWAEVFDQVRAQK
jgi:5,10-methylenetetrahydromethanopterin reductase